MTMAEVYRRPSVAKGRPERLTTPPRGAASGASVGAVGQSRRAASVPRLIDELVLPDPRHHRAQLLADDLDRMFRGHPAARHERRRARAIFEDELARVLARL